MQALNAMRDDLIRLVAWLLFLAYWLPVAVLVAAWILICLILTPITLPVTWLLRRARQRCVIREIKTSIQGERTARAWCWYAKAPAPPMLEEE